MQYFHENDELEKRLVRSQEGAFQTVSDNLDEMFENLFFSRIFGQNLYNAGVDELRNFIDREYYQDSYYTLHEGIAKGGTFEFFILFFKYVWGEEVVTTFTRDNAELNVEINPDILSTEILGVRRVNNVTLQYEYDDFVLSNGEYLALNVRSGIRTQKELDTIMEYISTHGIYTTSTLLVT